MHRGYPAEAFEAADVAAGAAADVLASFVVVGAEVGIDGVGIGEQGVADDQLGPADGALGFFLGHLVAQPPVLGAGEGLGASGVDGGLAEGARDVGVAAAGGVLALALSGGLADLGCLPGPGGQVPGGGEDGHVHSGLGDDVRGWAICARTFGLRSPAMTAVSMSRPDTPWMFVITDDSFRCASSSSFSHRAFSAVRAWTRCLR